MSLPQLLLTRVLLQSTLISPPAHSPPSAPSGPASFPASYPPPITLFRPESFLIPQLVFPTFQCAVHKSKVTKHRRGMRNRHKNLKNKTNITYCASCGKMMALHHHCAPCVKQGKVTWSHNHKIHPLA